MYRIGIIIVLILSGMLDAAAQKFPFFNVKVENGLVQSQATCLRQDSFGNLWIGTLGGLSRYDGKKIKNYTVSDGLASNSIIDLLFLQNGQLLISSSKGLQLFDGQRFVNIKTAEQLEVKGVSVLCQSANQKIFCLQNGFLNEVNLSKLRIIKLDNQNRFTTIECINNQLILAKQQGGLFVYTSGLKASFRSIAQIEDANLVVLKIFKDSKNHVWLMCNKGLYFQKEAKIFPYVIDGIMPITVPLLSAAEDKNGHLWFGSLQGAFRIRDSVVNYFDQNNGLTNNAIYKTICDKEGNIWMCSDGEGIFRYSGGPFISLDENFGLPNKQVTSIAGNENGEIYFSGYQGKLSSYRLGSDLKTINTASLQNDIITALKYQADKGLWIGTRTNGLFLRNENGLIKKLDLSQFDPFSSNISTLYLDQNGSLFVGFSRGLLQIADGKTKFIELDQSAPISMVNIGVDSILISSNNGFYLAHNGRATHWNPNPMFDSIVAQCMVKSNGLLFMGTSERGIIVYDCLKNSYQYLNSKNGLSSDFIYNLLKDNEEDIWVGTGMGVCKLSIEENNHIDIKFYGKANGIIGLESNSNASFEDRDGRIWFGTTEGVSCYFSNAHPTSSRPVSIVLESVNLYGGKLFDSSFFKSRFGWYNIPEELSLPYRFNNLSFAFQAITLSPVDKIYYRYKLDEANANWSDWTEENTINFSALEPGKYTLKVMCKVNEIEYTDTVLSYSFRVKTPFHKSIWFVVSIIVLAILSGVILQYSANRRKQYRLRREEYLRKEEQSRIRERTAEDFHDEVGNKLTRISVLTNVLKSRIEKDNVDAERIIQQIQDNSQQLYAGTRDILWSLQPSNDNLFEILNHVADLGIELFSETDISFKFTGNLNAYKENKMPLDKSRNFIMIWKEALNNCIKYSNAKNVLFQVQKTSEAKIQIRLVDDGQGFDLANAQNGNGIKNMNARAKRLDAQFSILSSLEKGTQIILTLP